MVFMLNSSIIHLHDLALHLRSSDPTAQCAVTLDSMYPTVAYRYFNLDENSEASHEFICCF